MIYFPELIRTEFIISALPDNCIDWSKVDRFSEEMRHNDLYYANHGFPEITGWPFIISRENIGETFLGAIDEEERIVSAKHIGQVGFYVTEGHHRSLAALKAGIYYFEYNIDFNQKHQFNK